MGGRNTAKGILSPLKITLIYLLVAALWITFTDQILEAFVSNMQTLSQFQTYKGLFYIVTTSLGLYLLITKYASQLNKSLQEKDTLLQEVHHRVKNNLAVISSFLQMQRLDSDSEMVQETLSKSETRIKSIALIHENMYQEESLSEINFKDYLEDLSSSIQLTIKGAEDVGIRVDSGPVILNVNQAVPCAIIINELVTNSLMHAFDNNAVKRGNEKIEVKLREHKGSISVEVVDNGLGVAENFDLEAQPSMGFSIIKTLIEQLGADYSINGQGGTHFIFSFIKEGGKNGPVTSGLGEGQPK
jgi:two-component sensor histidine kinase